MRGRQNDSPRERMIEIEPAEFGTISGWVSQARRYGLTFCPSTSYFVIRDCREIVGFAGYIKFKNKLISKNGFVLPRYRRKGYYGKMLDHTMGIAQKNDIGVIEATVTSMSLPIWEKRGAMVIREFKRYKKVRLVLPTEDVI